MGKGGGGGGLNVRTKIFIIHVKHPQVSVFIIRFTVRT